jgi:hypothetical protein
MLKKLSFYFWGLGFPKLPKLKEFKKRYWRVPEVGHPPLNKRDSHLQKYQNFSASQQNQK